MRSIYIPLIAIAFCLVTLLGITEQTDKLLEIKYTQLTKETQKQIDCLAANIYHEAKGESNDGKIAVALVTLNRTQDPRFPKDICSVVKQKVNSTCQFSWFCTPVTIKARELYDKARDVAIHVYVNYEKIPDITGGALFYHADYVNPQWKLQKTTVIGRHIFYKDKDRI